MVTLATCEGVTYPEILSAKKAGVGRPAQGQAGLKGLWVGTGLHRAVGYFLYYGVKVLFYNVTYISTNRNPDM